MCLNKFVIAVLFVFINKSISDCVKNRNKLVCKDIRQISQRFFNETTNTLQGITSIEIRNDNQVLGVAADSFSDGKNLEVVMLFKSNIHKLYSETFKDLPELRRLYLYYNQITDLYPKTFSNLPKLSNLLLNNNNLKFIRPGVFKNLPALNSLDLDNNLLSNIEDGVLTNFPSLARLRLNNNNIETIFVHKIISFPEKLEILWLHNNSLTVVSNFMLQNLVSLKVLNLGFNKISTIEAGSFSQTPNLITLVLTNNNLKELDGSAFPIRGLDLLDNLYIDHNYLMFLRSSFFIRLSGLKKITLMGNPWFCNCLYDIYRVISENNIEEKCQGDYVNAKRPICVSDGVDVKVCQYRYNVTMRDKYLEVDRSIAFDMNPLNCIL
uniref:Connectin-like n=1 Tax=Diabrotica virgifera virgifera TaxID=50390 RepID=A0A6P7G125_DIAVI